MKYRLLNHLTFLQLKMVGHQSTWKRRASHLMYEYFVSEWPGLMPRLRPIRKGPIGKKLAWAIRYNMFAQSEKE